MKKYDALYIFVGIAKDDALEACLEKALAEETSRAAPKRASFPT